MSLIEDLQNIKGVDQLENRSDGLWISGINLDVLEMANFFNSLEGRLSTITAIAIEQDETELIYHFDLYPQAVNLKTRTRNNSIASITPIIKAASWIEREIHDFFSVTFTGHPNPARLLLPPSLQQGLYRELGGAAGKALREKA